MMRKKTIFFLINSLECGGAERVVTLLAEEVIKNNVNVFLIVLEDKNRFYSVPEGVELISFNTNNVFKAVFMLRGYVSKYNPDTVLSFLTRSNYINVLCHFFSSRYYCVISERIHTSQHYSTGIVSSINRLIIKLLYPRSDKVIAVSREVEDDLCCNFGVCGNVVTINNPYDIDRINRCANEEHAVISRSYICAVGRLDKQKAFDFLIRAYVQANVKEDLVIIGAGDQEQYLKELVAISGYKARVHFLGLLHNPFPVISRARCFVLSSVNEGFPNVLLEAMSLGVPVVATNCTPVTEYILNGLASEGEPAMAEYGLIVPVNDVLAMRNTIRMYCNEDDVVEHYRKMSSIRAREFSIDRIAAEYCQQIFSGNSFVNAD